MRHVTTQAHHSQSAHSRGVPVAAYSFPARHSAFTLMELMIAVTILLLLTFITATVVNSTMESDRVPSGARRVQSYLEGARDRAIYSTKTLNPGPRGVRFLRDPNGLKTDLIDEFGNPIRDNQGNIIQVLTAVTSMIYIGPPKLFSEGGVKIGEDGNPPDMRKIVPFNTNWRNLKLRKFLLNGARIRIPAVRGKFYTIIFNTSDNNWYLTKDYPASKFPRTEYDYELELEPAVLPNQEPRLLPRNVVIDVKSGFPRHSVIPRFWNENPNFRNRMDILFSPQGTVVGRSAVGGHIHLVVTDLADAEEGRYTGQRDFPDTQGNLIPGKEGDEKIISINTRTGSVTVHSVDPTDLLNNNDVNDTTPDGIPDDPFRFAETGEES